VNKMPAFLLSVPICSILPCPICSYISDIPVCLLAGSQLNLFAQLLLDDEVHQSWLGASRSA
jgi:hypothetical protein